MSRPVLRTTSRVTHAARAAELAAGVPPQPDRAPSVERLAQLERGTQASAGLILIAVRVSPGVTLEGDEDLAERVRRHVNGQWFTVFGGRHQMIATDAWPAPDGWQAPE